MKEKEFKSVSVRKGVRNERGKGGVRKRVIDGEYENGKRWGERERESVRERENVEECEWEREREKARGVV